nr:glycosyltransferase N-terminal domain-containing protein [Pseudogemmobacter hezensis]
MQAPPDRLGERFGKASLPRPDLQAEGRLIWLHAASVGEVVSIIPLAGLLLAQPGLRVLITTTSATGATVVANRIPGALHQFAPIDTPAAVTGFLDHWRPDAALFVEGDLWPRMMQTLAVRGIPAALVNARPSKTRSRAPRSFAVLLRPMHLITLQEDSLRDEFLRLGVAPGILHAPGNLKADIAAPAVDPALVQAWQQAARPRSIWAAASTHEGEEEIVLDALSALDQPGLLLLAPRHPPRAESVADLLKRRGISFTRQSLGQQPDANTAVHLIDTLGLMGSVYAAADLALIGGSLRPGPGGHTPYEAAAAGCPILAGPYLRNAAAAYQALGAAGAMREVTDAASLAQTVAGLLADPALLHHMQSAARAEQSRHQGASQRSLALLLPLLNLRPGPENSETGAMDGPE